MSSNAAIALSGIAAAKLGLEASAENIANLATPDYHRQLVQQTSQPGGGVSAVMMRDTQPGEDLVQDLVQQLVSTYAFKANVVSLQTEQGTIGNLLDLLA